jgi:hypothetical protein
VKPKLENELQLKPLIVSVGQETPSDSDTGNLVNATGEIEITTAKGEEDVDLGQYDLAQPNGDVQHPEQLGEEDFQNVDEPEHVRFKFCKDCQLTDDIPT